MTLKITHTCEWCNKTEKVETLALPMNWITGEVHDPVARLNVKDGGGFCSSKCQNLYGEHRPAARASAEEHYKNEFYSFMNKMKAAEMEKAKA